MNVHSSNYLQKTYGSQVVVDYMSINDGKIEQLKYEIKQLKKEKMMSPNLSIQNKVDETIQSNILLQKQILSTISMTLGDILEEYKLQMK